MPTSSRPCPVPYHFQDHPQLHHLSFTKDDVQAARDSAYAENWPVVYILSNGTEAYVGETNNFIQRMYSHLDNPERDVFESIDVVYDPQYNKSVALDLEAVLISMMQVDGRFTLHNLNGGQSMVHDYYMRSCYRSTSFPQVWTLLQGRNLADHAYGDLRNSDLYKFSPYHDLNPEQFATAQELLMRLTHAVISGQQRTFLVRGEAGTGKTLLGIYLLNRLTRLFLPAPSQSSDVRPVHHILNAADLLDRTGALEATAYSIQMARYLDSLLTGEYLAQTDPDLIDDYLKQRAGSAMTIGFVIPQPSLRQTLQNVVRHIPGLSPDLIIGPQDVLKKEYDLLIVDEAHRLRQRSNMPSYVHFDAACEQLGLQKETATELDWILLRSKYRILFYDAGQAVKGASISPAVFSQLRQQHHCEAFRLNSQMRCMGGQDYVRFVDALFSPDQTPVPTDFQGSYDLRFYDSFADMRNALMEQEKQMGLCRLLAGNGWPWSTNKFKARDLYDPVTGQPRAYDFILENIPLVWNSARMDWVNSAHTLDEVGSVDKVQGYDLNYAAVILGPELTWNAETGHIEVVATRFADKKSKEKKSAEEITQLVFNIYRVLMTRGIHGTFVYVVDETLRDALRSLFLDCR